MIPTFENYLEEKNSLTFNDMQRIHAAMVADIGTDKDALDLYSELLDMATKYASIRMSWMSLSKQAKMDEDEKRTICHDSLIIKVRKLSRSIGKEHEWNKILGEDRKRIGDFACYLAFLNSLHAR